MWSPLSSTWHPDSSGDHALLGNRRSLVGRVVGVALFLYARLRAQICTIRIKIQFAYLQVFNIQNQENSS